MQTEQDTVVIAKAGSLIKVESRYATSPTEVKTMNTERIRQDFLIENLFVANQFTWVLSFFDRYLTGGLIPGTEALTLRGKPRLWGYGLLPDYRTAIIPFVSYSVNV